MNGLVERRQTDAARAALRKILGASLQCLFLCGSAVLGGLRAQSDIDLLAITSQEMSPDQRQALLSALLRISAPYPAPPGGPRCLELLVLAQPGLTGFFPIRADFIYGEWLRDRLASGHPAPPHRDPEYTLLLAQAQQHAIPLFGCPDGVLPPIPPHQVRRAMRQALPALVQGLRDDQRNVLLTLARMWQTAQTGEFVTKDAAAAWAAKRLPAEQAAILDHARLAYLGQAATDHYPHDEASQLARTMRARVTALL